jgi:O-antigen/teichoic acid export membrane protein
MVAFVRRSGVRLAGLIRRRASDQRRAAFGTSATNILIGGLGLMSGLLAARLLGAHGRGELAAIQTWPMVLAMLTSAGLPEALTFWCAREPERSREWVLTAVAITAGITAIVATLGYAALPFLLSAQSPETIHMARVYLWILPVLALTGISFNVVRGLGHLRTWNAMRCAPGVLWLAIMVTAPLTDGSGAATIALRFMVLLPIVCVALLLSMNRDVSGPYRVSGDSARRLLRFGLPCTLTAVPQIFVLRLDQLFMAAFLPAQALGLYAVGVAWAGVTLMVAQGVGHVLFPRVAAASDGAERARIIRSALKDVVIVIAFLVPALLVVTPFLLPRLFGADFIAAVPAAAILVVAAGVASFNGVVEEALRGLGQPRIAMHAELAGLAVTVPALVVMLPRFGVIGAAATSLAAYVVVAIILIRKIRPLVTACDRRAPMLVLTT